MMVPFDQSPVDETYEEHSPCPQVSGPTPRQNCANDKKVHNGKTRAHRAEPPLRGTVQPQLRPLDIAGTPG
jgi:hypothetical protein